MTDSPDSVKRAWFYCRKCHESVMDEKMVVKCECKRSAVRQLEQSRTGTARRRRKTLSGGGGREVQLQCLERREPFQTEAFSHSCSTAYCSSAY